jgi:signal transduction histidine kinase
MASDCPLDKIAGLGPGDHLCILYETEEEHRALLTPFLRQGLERGEKVLYVVDAHAARTVLDYLRDDGLEVEPYLASGQLSILAASDAYMSGGGFDPDGMISFLRAETGRAMAEGYSALRITGEMSWVLRGLPGSERLIEYEAKLNEFFPGSKCAGLCQYDRRRFDPTTLLDVLSTHPTVVVGTAVYDNFYYIPPARFLSLGPSEAKLRQWLDNLAERKRTEAELREHRDHLEEYAERLKYLRELDQVILAARSSEEIAHATLSYLQQLLPYQQASVTVFDFGADEAVVLAARLGSRRRKGAGTRLLLKGFGVPEGLEQGKVHMVDDVLTISQPSALAQALPVKGLRSYVNIPLITQGELIGSLNLGADRPGAFSPEQVDIVREVTGVLAVAIRQAQLFEQVQASRERLRRLVQQVVSAQEEERQHLSRELHDEAGQALTVLKISLGLLQADLPAESGPLRQRLAEIIALTDTTMEQIRLLAQNLRPPALDAVGLNPTLESLCHNFASHTQLTIDYLGTELSALPEEVNICLYRFLQESLTNAAKYASASRVRVALSYDAEEVSLSVEDDGQGFDKQAVLSVSGRPTGMGIGLLGMQERLERLGGRLDVESHPGQGTRLVAHIAWEEVE